MSRPGRTTLTAIITNEAYDGWADYAAAQGVTMSALVEALGLIFPAGLPSRMETELVTIARQVTAERRSRRHPRG